MEKDGYGFNKSKRLAAERERRAKESAPLPLDPEFPFHVIPFDARFFDAFPDHPKPPESDV